MGRVERDYSAEERAKEAWHHAIIHGPPQGRRRAHHIGYVLSGRMKVVMDDGTEAEAGAGDAAVIPPGHDAWIEGDEPCVWLEFAGADRYAAGSSQGG